MLMLTPDGLLRYWRGHVARQSVSHVQLWSIQISSYLFVSLSIVGVHNVVFGLLGTIAFTMHEIGMTYDEVRARTH